MALDLMNLEQVLDRLQEAAEEEGKRITLGKMIQAVGNRSFGPLLLFPGIILASPLSGIPGIPTTMGLLVISIAIQLLFGRHFFWLPRWVLNRSFPAGKTNMALNWLRPIARFVDRWLQPRWTFLVGGVGAYVISIVCIITALGLPFMEIIPFLAHGAGATFCAFGLSLTMHDGLFALLAFLFIALTFGVLFHTVN